jgi:hypothetical protein
VRHGRGQRNTAVTITIETPTVSAAQKSGLDGVGF